MEHLEWVEKITKVNYQFNKKMYDSRINFSKYWAGRYSSEFIIQWTPAGVITKDNMELPLPHRTILPPRMNFDIRWDPLSVIPVISMPNWPLIEDKVMNKYMENPYKLTLVETTRQLGY